MDEEQNQQSAATNASEGGVSASYAWEPTFEVPLAPTTEEERNTLRPPLLPIACWRLDDLRFRPHTSCPLPEATAEMKTLADLRKKHPGAPLSIFGHADATPKRQVEEPKQFKLIIRPTDSIWPVKLAEICTGNANRYKELEPCNPHLMKGPGQWRNLYAGDEINLPQTWTRAEREKARARGYLIEPPEAEAKQQETGTDEEAAKRFSGRRARSIYALLTRDAEDWEALYSQPEGADVWGVEALRMMLAAVGATDELLPYQEDALSRKMLFLAYMDKLCGVEFVLQRADFLARGADGGGKGDYQGCGAFNPTLILSKEEEERLNQSEDAEARWVAYGRNRRVLIYLFRPGVEMSVGSWPCPRVGEGVAGCKKRFWSDGELRRKPQAERREYEKGGETFACRFYERLANDSPCERPLSIKRTVHIRIFDPFARPISGAPYRLTIGPHIYENKADKDGWAIIIDDSMVKTGHIAWGYPPDEAEYTDRHSAYVYQTNLFLDPDEELKTETEQQDIQDSKTVQENDDHNAEATRRRLHHLGFNLEADVSDNIRAFQRVYGKSETGYFQDIAEELHLFHDLAKLEPFPSSQIDGGNITDEVTV